MDGSDLLARLGESSTASAIIWRGREYSYADVISRVNQWREVLAERSIEPGMCVALSGDFSPGTATLLLALIANGNIAIPLTRSVLSGEEREERSVYANAVFEFDSDDQWEYRRRESAEDHILLDGLRERRESGLVLFSSGSTGKAKASLHSFPKLLTRFEKRGHTFRMLTFLLLDHMGGVNTLLSILCNGGTAVTISERSAEAVCQAIEDYRVEILPATPTFLNMMLISEAYRRFDLSSIQYISYGTEPMPETTLIALREVFPGVKLRQLYGLTELGILPTKTHSDNALKVKLGGDGCEVKIVDGILWIRAETAMLGYLNAPSPFDKDGWFNTGDAVVQEGDFLRVLGRESELINVGGEKVFPAEVENVVLQMENIRDVVVWGKSNPITGSIVAARVRLERPEPAATVERRIRDHCRQHLAHFKIPAFIEIAEDDLHGERFKRIRKPQFLKTVQAT